MLLMIAVLARAATVALRFFCDSEPARTLCSYAFVSQTARAYLWLLSALSVFHSKLFDWRFCMES
jgi:hypothetical protein